MEQPISWPSLVTWMSLRAYSVPSQPSVDTWAICERLSEVEHHYGGVVLCIESQNVDVAVAHDEAAHGLVLEVRLWSCR